MKKNITIALISLGCAKNLVDSQIMAEELLSSNMIITPIKDYNDVILINTCAFIEDAIIEANENIAFACNQKKNGACAAVIVAGCLPQRFKDSIKNDFPEVDAFIGIDNLKDISQIVTDILNKNKRILRVTEQKKLFSASKNTPIFTTGAYAYLKIAEGCNHTCAFCTIPSIRGKLRSRSIHSILKEARMLLQRGFKELILISQDTTSYGKDIQTSLIELLSKLDSMKGDFKIRFLYGFPNMLKNELLTLIRDSKHIYPYFDIPIQHSHPEILKSMRRGYTAQSINNLTYKIKSIIPDAIIRTTCIVGFPGETEKHFLHLLDYIKKMQFDHLGVFPYSPEDGTYAFSLPNKPNQKIAIERQSLLLQTQQKIVQNKLSELISKKENVLLEEYIKEKDVFKARSKRQAPDIDGYTYISGVPKNIDIASFVTVEYTKFDGYDIFAKFLEVNK